jgi:alkanesulfonate monooxygenase SsuD/methylene tetrahydromethanopterin reductase-like flavin-dependent oxidoreductase (luciferase family)
MDIGVGLPSTVRGASGETLVEWAKTAEQAGFSTLAALGRLVYDSYDGLVALSAAAAVTSRIRLATAILLSPLHGNGAVLAKQAASLDRLSNGRLVLGMAAGSRPDDFKAADVPMKGRGAFLERQVTEARAIWSGERRGFAGGIGPAPVRPGGPEIMLGGHSPRAVDRAARLADSWISGGGGVEMFAGGAAAFRAAWTAAGRTEPPRVVALTYFALGPHAEDLADRYISEYYGFAPPYAQIVLRGAAVGEAKLKDTLARLEAAGCDEVLLTPCGDGLDQLKELQDVTLS